MPETPPHHGAPHHRDGSEDPITHPTNQVIGVVDAEERAAAAIEALVAGGFLDSEVRLARGRERADEIGYRAAAPSSRSCRRSRASAGHMRRQRDSVTPGADSRHRDGGTCVVRRGWALLVAVATATVAACSAGAPEARPERDTGVNVAADPVEPVDSIGRTEPTVWYRRHRALDLSGDGEPDSAVLTAVGARPDSLRITLALSVGGASQHREEWASGYELALADSGRRAGAQLDSLVRARLDSVLAGVRVQRLDAPGVRLMAEDSALLARLEPRPTHRITFSYGYETTVRLVWDAPRQRFVRLWSCC